MVERYTRAEMGKLWTVQARFQNMLEVEVAVAQAQAEMGLIPPEAAKKISEKGRFEVAGQLKITTSGVVLRGSEGTVVVATGTDRRALIRIAGVMDRKAKTDFGVADAYVPVGALTLRVQSVGGLQVGEEVVIARPGTKEWIAAVGMDVSPGRQQFAWRPAAMRRTWTRHVVAIDGDKVTLDAPLTTSLDEKFGGGTLTTVTWPGRISQVGVENLRLESTFDAANPLDEQHEASLIDHSERVDDRMQREDTNRYLRKCLDALPREQAQLIELHYFRGVSLNEAVMLTGVPINTIKTRMYLARRKLAKMMAAEEHRAEGGIGGHLAALSALVEGPTARTAMT